MTKRYNKFSPLETGIQWKRRLAVVAQQDVKMQKNRKVFNQFVADVFMQHSAPRQLGMILETLLLILRRRRRLAAPQ